MITSHFMRHLIETVRRILVTTWPSGLVALAAWISIVVCIDPAGSYPSMPEGPGLTIDEVFNVQQGVYLVENTRVLGWLNLAPGTSLEAFKPRNGYNPDHPPLGRYWLGVHHQLTWWLAPPSEPDGPFVTACARTGSATAFALTVWLVGAFAACARKCAGREREDSGRGLSMEEPGDLRPPLRGGNVSGWQVQLWEGLFASLALVLMPRVYGHAHLAALETITNLTCTAAVLAIAVGWNSSSAPTYRSAMLVGIVMGLAMLTKIQAILIPIPVIVWALCRWRLKALVPLLVWGLTALTVFFAGWPYLWLDPLGHFLEYLGRTTHRATIHCFYFGVRYDDKSVPWHYPFVMFAVTVPVGLHILGAIGIGSRTEASPFEQKSDGAVCEDARRWQRRPRLQLAWGDWLLLGCCLFPLVVFALPGVAVYDGERLFLSVFPLWAIFVGRGAVRVLAAEIRRYGKWLAKFAMTSLIALQFSSNLFMYPCYLSYYNLAVGGLWGADALGMEMNYWGDAITRNFLERTLLEQGGFRTIEILPSLHQFQNEDLIRQSPILRRRRVKEGNVTLRASANPLRIAFRRRADLDDKLFQKYASRGKGKGGSDYMATIAERPESRPR